MSTSGSTNIGNPRWIPTIPKSWPRPGHPKSASKFALLSDSRVPPSNHPGRCSLRSVLFGRGGIERRQGAYMCRLSEYRIGDTHHVRSMPASAAECILFPAPYCRFVGE